MKTANGQLPSMNSSNNLMCCLVLFGHVSPICSLALDTDLDVVVSGSAAGKICIHTVRRGTFIRSMEVKDFLIPQNNVFDQNKERQTHRTPSTLISVRKLALHKHGVFVAHLESGLLQM